MRVIGSTFKKILAEKNKEITSQVSISTDMKIIDIKNSKSELFLDKDTFTIDYSFKINYLPEFANLVFEGSLVLLMDGKDDDKISEKIKEGWKNKKTPDELTIPLLKIIFTRCNLKALQLEEYTNLPPHLPTPEFSKETKISEKNSK